MQYYEDNLQSFEDVQYMFWSPRVPVGYITENLKKIETLNSVINVDYAMRVNELRHEAKKTTRNTGNPFFRALQILEHLKPI